MKEECGTRSAGGLAVAPRGGKRKAILTCGSMGTICCDGRQTAAGNDQICRGRKDEATDYRLVVGPCWPSSPARANLLYLTDMPGHVAAARGRRRRSVSRRRHETREKVISSLSRSISYVTHLDSAGSVPPADGAKIAGERHLCQAPPSASPPARRCRAWRRCRPCRRRPPTPAVASQPTVVQGGGVTRPDPRRRQSRRHSSVVAGDAVATAASQGQIAHERPFCGSPYPGAAAGLGGRVRRPGIPDDRHGLSGDLRRRGAGDCQAGGLRTSCWKSSRNSSESRHEKKPLSPEAVEPPA